MRGTIQSLVPDKGFGFIRPVEGGPDVFVHRSAYSGAFPDLAVGQRVEYEMDADADRPRARQLTTVEGLASSRPNRPLAAKAGRRPPEVRKHRSSNAPRSSPPAPADCVCGFVTKLRTKVDPPHGFVSPDASGPEVRFAPQVVQSPFFSSLRVGDYVQFAVLPETANTREPIARFVQKIERTINVPRTQLGRHPNSRRKKPSWR